MDNQSYNSTSTTSSGGGQGMAIASMVLGIIGLISCCCIVPTSITGLGLVFVIPGILINLLAAVFGIVSLAAKKPGKGMAIAGLVCSLISLIACLLIAIGGAALFAAIKGAVDAL